MKKVLLIGNRLNAYDALKDFSDLKLVKVLALDGSLLHKHLINNVDSAEEVFDAFSMGDKGRIIRALENDDFDILISNGCPFILPVSKLKKDHQLYINIHPTLLPDLKGRTPLNGVFMTHREKIGATMHYIDDGIDTGKIIAQVSIALTPDIDQGLIYKLSFDSEKTAFSIGMGHLVESNYEFIGHDQDGKGSYFNRSPEMQQIDIETYSTDKIIDTIKSFGVKTQGSFLVAGSKRFCVYSAERIVNEHLLERYVKRTAGEIVMEYDGKIIIKTKDGLIKMTDYILDTIVPEKV